MSSQPTGNYRPFGVTDGPPPRQALATRHPSTPLVRITPGATGGKGTAPATSAAQSLPSPALLASISLVCQEFLGTSAVAVELPGGADRCSCRVRLADGRSVIATRRPTQHRARLEEGVLRHLRAHGAPVPRVLGFTGVLLLQEDLGTQRLPTFLVRASAEEAVVLLRGAIAGLRAIRRAADAAGLDGSVLALGADRRWLATLIQGPAMLGQHLGVRCPAPEARELLDQITPWRPRFVKWDARPSNVVVRADGSMGWIDWADCGGRHPLDDLVWLLGDELVPDLPPAVEEPLLAAAIEGFAAGMAEEQAGAYLAAFGTLHITQRLATILQKRGTGPWRQLEDCLTSESAGVTLEHALRLCRRGARWSARCRSTAALAPWFEEIGGRIENS